MPTHFPILPAKTTTGRWLWLVGGIAFLIPLVLPLLVGALFPLLVWHLGFSSFLCCIGPQTPREVFFLPLFFFLSLPLALSIAVTCLWRWVNKSDQLLTPGRGMLAFFGADLLTAITGFLVSTLFLVLPPFSTLDGESLGFLWLGLCVIIVAQTFYSLPFLLLAGALVARWQARAQATAS